MDIRDELDAMLDNLKRGTSAPKKTTPSKPQTAAPRSSVYDKMSVDELVTALSDEKKTPSAAPVSTEKKNAAKAPNPDKNGIPKNLLDMLSGGSKRASDNIKKVPTKPGTVRPEAVRKPTMVVPKPIIEEPKSEIILEPVIEEPKVEIVPKPVIEKPKAEIVPEPVIEEPKAEIVPKPIIEEHSPVVEDAPLEPLKPPKKKKRIVINHDLPNYEEIRRKALEEAASDEAEKQPHEAEPIIEEQTFPEIPEESETETVFDKLSEREPVTFDEELSDAVEDEIPEDEEDAQQPESKPKKGLFSAIKSVFSSKKTEDAEENETESAPDDDQQEEITLDEEELPEENIPVEDLFEENPTEEEPVETEPFTDETSEPESETLEGDPSDELISELREEAETVIHAFEESAEAADYEIVEDVHTEEIEESDGESSDEKDSADDADIDIELEKPAKTGRLTAALKNILDEDPAEISNERSEKKEVDDIDVSLKKSGTGKAKRRIYSVLGVIFTLLAAVGLVSVIKFGIVKFNSFTSGENKKDGFMDVVYPAVIMDIESFSNPSELSSEQIITAAIWSIVMSDDDMAKYENTFDVISVPAVDVDAYAAKLFGDGIPTLTHGTVGAGDLKFYYNEETKRYNIPVQPISFTYEPKITSVSKNGNDYTVRVDYYKELPSWMKNKKRFTAEVSKTVEFGITEKDGSYSVSSMVIVSVNSSI